MRARKDSKFQDFNPQRDRKKVHRMKRSVGLKDREWRVLRKFPEPISNLVR